MRELAIIKTKAHKGNLILFLKILAPGIIAIRGENRHKENSVYFDLQKNAESPAYEPLVIQMPLIPKSLLLRHSDNVQIINFKVLELSECDLWIYPNEEKAARKLMDFAQDAGTLPEGMYRNVTQGIAIHYLPYLSDDDTGELLDHTPARIHHGTGELQINAPWFRAMTIPTRVFILLHEFYHWYLDEKSELECDAQAIRVYMHKGFPSLDGLHALTNIVPATRENVDRMNQLAHLIEENSLKCDDANQ